MPMNENTNTGLANTTKEQYNQSGAQKLLVPFRAWLHKMLDLQEGLDREGTIISIKNNKKMQGANAWMLGCSIMIASLGLDLNSPAVIIGAMLVSPLMSPILGVGLGVAINDKDTFFTSLKHFGLAILIALVTSTIYFFVSPFGQVTSEIQSRTSPTVLDGLVAVFGGLAGIISITRKDKSNAIPGVAIATALMPPLCVTGFGIAEMLELLIAQGEFTIEKFNQSFNAIMGIIGGSFYLFFLNSFFIALTTYVIIRLLGFPMRSYVNPKEAYRNRIITALFSVIIILPSAWILYNLYALQKDKQEVNHFIEDYFPKACIKHDLTPLNGDTNKLIIQLLGRRITEDSISFFEDVLHQNYQLNNKVKLFPMQAELSMEDLKNSLREQKEEVITMIEAERQLTEEAIKKKKEKEEALQKKQRDSINIDKGLRLAREAFPDQLMSISYASQVKGLTDSAVVALPPTFIANWKYTRSASANNKKLEAILKVGTDFKDIQVWSAQ
jgi:uncharacterized hydrophobic protein (TIGR00271 family)